MLPTDAALDIARTLLAPLRLAMRAVLALGLVVALAAFLVGPSAPARWLRSLGGRARAAARARLEGDRVPSPVEAWIGGHKGVLRVGIVGAGGAGARLLDLPERGHGAGRSCWRWWPRWR